MRVSAGDLRRPAFVSTIPFRAIVDRCVVEPVEGGVPRLVVRIRQRILIAREFGLTRIPVMRHESSIADVGSVGVLSDLGLIARTEPFQHI